MGNLCGKSAKCAHASSTNLADASKSTSNNTRSNPSVSSGFAEKGSDAIKSQNNLYSFSFADLKNATRNFKSDSLVGEGGFGMVFKGWLSETNLSPCKPGTGKVVAVKRLKRESFQGHKEWLAEVNYLGQLRHQNLVKLIGYCAESENRLLVYEFLPRGSLENHLFRKGVQPISWSLRMSIAVGVARGLTFLHGLDSNVIFRDLKAANVLLDSDFCAKLSDFGLARDGPTGDNTHVSTRVVGTQGYAAPEYVATGHLSPKSDVYSFGVVLLELLTGRPAMDEEKAGCVEETLVDWAKPFLKDPKRVLRIMDTRLAGQYSRKGAHAAASLALHCLHTDPKHRPLMPHVLQTLSHISPSTNAL